MIYVFGDLRQLRSFELARMLETPSSAKQKDLPRPPASIQPVAVQAPLTGPPLLRHHSPSFAPSPKATRPLPPKLRLTTPPPAHTIMHVHTSRSSSSHAHMQTCVCIPEANGHVFGGRNNVISLPRVLHREDRLCVSFQDGAA